MPAAERYRHWGVKSLMENFFARTAFTRWLYPKK